MIYIKFKLYIQILSINLLLLFSEEVEECPKETPIKYETNCEMRYCTEFEYKNKFCTISNTIIKTQWLNNIILEGDTSYIYINPLITYNNELILSTYPYNDNKTNEIYKKRKFYGIQTNGRPLFYNKNTELLESQKISTLSSPLSKELSEVIYLKAFDVDNPKTYYEYYFILGTTDQYYETFSLKRSKNSKGSLSSFFGENPTNKKYYIDSSYNKNETLLSFIGYKDNQYKLMFKGFSVYYNSSLKVLKYTYNSIRDVRNTGMNSCLRTENNLFGCFYVNSENQFSFSILSFTYGDIISSKNPEVILTEIIDSSKIQENKDLFYKCIHLKKEIAVFSYFNQENNLYIKLNEFINRGSFFSIDNIQIININKYYFNSNFEYCDLIKINDDRFFFTSITNDNLNIISLITI